MTAVSTAPSVWRSRAPGLVLAAGAVLIAVALVVKLTRVLMLAPIVAVAGIVERRRNVSGGLLAWLLIAALALAAVLLFG
ncbi:hypothetical protein SAMN05216219_2928 [Mycetocola miduiensis]|uniref:Uncharacterized protein n=1 Tax=Mycetocola miduiensis TaxID=995034 RepID=A0A1I5DHR4_9MICO|nr:hypothetical protein SAMN05216219_2928 [Mycetocola miduiensis]